MGPKRSHFLYTLYAFSVGLKFSLGTYKQHPTFMYLPILKLIRVPNELIHTGLSRSYNHPVHFYTLHVITARLGPEILILDPPVRGSVCIYFTISRTGINRV